jgi:hypothetical protein
MKKEYNFSQSVKNPYLKCKEDDTPVKLLRDRLIVEPIRRISLLSLLATLEAITENFPDMDEGLLPLDDITL